MFEIKEVIRESIRLQKDLEFLEDFEQSISDEFVTKSQILKLISIVSTALIRKIDNNN